MKKIMKKAMPAGRQGFTLVELLIVIALLGALAIGLIGALDPFEQLKKGTDTGVRNTVSEIQAAMIRYYALKGYMPWCESTSVCTASPPGGATPGGLTLDEPVTMAPAIQKVVDAGELKSNFTTVQSNQLGEVTVASDADNAAVIVCYYPGSKSFRSDNNTVYTDLIGTKQLAADIVGLAPADICTGLGGTKKCWWCVM